MLGVGRVLARGGAAGQTGTGGTGDFYLPRTLAGFSLAADYDGFGLDDGAASGIGQAVGSLCQRLRADLCGVGVDARADDRGFRLFSAVVYQRDSARGGEGVTDMNESLDLLDVSQWDFYILPTAALEREAKEQKTIGLASLERLGARKVSFGQIHDTIRDLLTVSKTS